MIHEWSIDEERRMAAYYGQVNEPFTDLPGYDPNKCVWLYCGGDCERCDLNNAESL